MNARQISKIFAFKAIAINAMIALRESGKTSGEFCIDGVTVQVDKSSRGDYAVIGKEFRATRQPFSETVVELFEVTHQWPITTSA